MSPTTTSAPTASSGPAAPAERTRARTRWPVSTASRHTCEPTNPVAPVTSRQDTRRSRSTDTAQFLPLLGLSWLLDGDGVGGRTNTTPPVDGSARQEHLIDSVRLAVGG